MRIHYQPGRDGHQDQCIVNKRNDYGHHAEPFRCVAHAKPRRAYACRTYNQRRCRYRSSDCEPHKIEEPNDGFTPMEYGAHAEEEEERCSRDAYDIKPG